MYLYSLIRIIKIKFKSYLIMIVRCPHWVSREASPKLTVYAIRRIPVGTNGALTSSNVVFFGLPFHRSSIAVADVTIP